MNISGVENKTLNTITLKHSGKQMNFCCHIKPYPYIPNQAYEPGRMTIYFDDILEIDSMIDMLTQMRKLCVESIGFWNIGKE